jgi:hypothetical protein
MDKYLKSLREIGFSTVTADDVRPSTKPEPPREEIVPAPAAGHAPEPRWGAQPGREGTVQILSPEWNEMYGETVQSVTVLSPEAAQRLADEILGALGHTDGTERA